MLDRRLQEEAKKEEEHQFWRGFFLHWLEKPTPKQKQQQWEEKYEPYRH